MEAIYYYLNYYGYLGIFLLLALGIFGPPVADIVTAVPGVHGV